MGRKGNNKRKEEEGKEQEEREEEEGIEEESEEEKEFKRLTKRNLILNYFTHLEQTRGNLIW